MKKSSRQTENDDIYIYSVKQTKILFYLDGPSNTEVEGNILVF